MEQFIFTSKLETQFKDELESLLFFNPQQQKFVAEIESAVNDYGSPDIDDDGEFLRISIPGLQNLQCLFAMDPKSGSNKLAGLIVYFRVQLESLLVIHTAVAEKYSSKGEYAKEYLLSAMVEKVREVGRRIRGVRTVNFKYRSNCVVSVDQKNV